MSNEPQAPGSQVSYSLRRENVLTRLDPELQNAVLNRGEGWLLPRYLCERRGAGYEVVDVIAKLRRTGAKVKGLNVSQRIGRVVTGTVAVKDIVRVRQHRDVLSLKGARRLRRMIADSVPEIRACPQQIRKDLRGYVDGDSDDLDGAGVIVGVVDSSCDFAHPNFRRLDGATPDATRILYLWDQRPGPDETPPAGHVRPPCGYGYGREFDDEALNRALEQPPRDEDDFAAPHRYLGYAISSDNGHGTRVLDIAAGSGGGKHARGVAPGADIIFVEVSIAQEADASLGNSRRLLEAVKYVFDKASELKKPAVVNISLNYDGGPHDGTTPVEEAFDLLLETPGRAIVIAAGNSRNQRRHVRRVVHPGEVCTLLWGVSKGDDTDNKLEVWYEGRHRLEVTLTPPDGPPLGPVRPDTTATVLRHDKLGGRDVKVGRVFNRLRDPSNGDNHIAVILDDYAKHGVWEVGLRSIGGRSVAPFAVHAWIERDDATSVFADARDEDHAYTLGTLACGHSTIVVTGYDPLRPEAIPDDHAEGPTRDGRPKPEVSAPATNLTVARVLSDTVGPSGGGTSLAAPHVTGMVALLMQAARRSLPIEKTRAFVTGRARRAPPPRHGAWDSRYGAGRVNVAASVLDCVLEREAAAAEVAAALVIKEEHKVVVAEIVAPPSASGALGAAPDPSGGAAVAALAVETKIVSVVAITPPEVSDDLAPAVPDGGDAAADGMGDTGARPEPPEAGGD